MSASRGRRRSQFYRLGNVDSEPRPSWATILKTARTWSESPASPALLCRTGVGGADGEGAPGSAARPPVGATRASGDEAAPADGAAVPAGPPVSAGDTWRAPSPPRAPGEMLRR